MKQIMQHPRVVDAIFLEMMGNLGLDILKKEKKENMVNLMIKMEN